MADVQGIQDEIDLAVKILSLVISFGTGTFINISALIDAFNAPEQTKEQLKARIKASQVKIPDW